MSDDKKHAAPTEETRAAVGARAAGCLLALVGLGVLLSLNDALLGSVPPFIVAVIAIALGVGSIMAYIRVVTARWGMAPPDVVQMVGRDLGAFRNRRLDDYRVRFSKGTGWKERGLHELLYALKWLGHLLVFAGLGWILYRLFVFSGIVKP